MQRHLWAVAVLLGAAVTGARADFVKILVSLAGLSAASGGAGATGRRPCLPRARRLRPRPRLPRWAET